MYFWDGLERGKKGIFMEYSHIKERLISLFDYNKLQSLPGEWGFFNEIEREINKVGYATSITQEIIKKASELDIDFLLTHHDSWEFIYGLKESCNQGLEEHGITHAFFHAPLDDADFGTSASLAKALGIGNCKKVMPYAELYYGGVIGDMPPIGFSSLLKKLSDILQEELRCFQNNDKIIQKVAVAAGGGNMTNEMRVAVENGCDAYITGEYVLYSQQYAEHSGMNLFVGSHTNTEILGVETLAELISKQTDIQIIRITEPKY